MKETEKIGKFLDLARLLGKKPPAEYEVDSITKYCLYSWNGLL